MELITQQILYHDEDQIVQLKYFLYDRSIKIDEYQWNLIKNYINEVDTDVIVKYKYQTKKLEINTYHPP
jgi:hypothetical protein